MNCNQEMKMDKKQNLIEWLKMGVLDGIILIQTAQKIYSVQYDDFTDGVEKDFRTFLFSK